MPLPFHETKTKPEAWTTSKIDFPPHLHGCPELVYVSSGALTVCIDSKEYTLQKGDLAVILPNIIHSYQSVSPSEETEIYFMICGKLSQNALLKKYAGAYVENPVSPIESFHPDVGYMFFALYEEITESPSSHIIDNYFQLLWMRLLPSLRVSSRSREPASDLAVSSLIYISEHFREPITLDVLSRELGICRFYLSRIFSHVLHVGFCEYVNTLRINYSKELLLSSDLGILDIGMRSGFQSQQSFNRVFKEMCGTTPAAYRKRSSGR